MKHVSDVYNELVFDKNKMKKKLNKETYQKLLPAIEGYAALDESIAADVAHAMKEWAVTNGATHFTHWFQPQRGGTAEKHDAFIDYDTDGRIIERFSAAQLIQSEPDASSFPSGGMRSTFEARGYTAWDPTSPAFLLEAANSRTLVIPSVFLSWTGHVLDIKTPLLRSQHALDDIAVKLQKFLGNRMAKKTKVFVGPEQEYFLFAKELLQTRPDLKVCGRTLFGAAPARGQQMDDHYFGAIKSKVLAFMEEFDHELYRRGIPAKTRHNEVSPNQFEIAPLYTESNRGIDNNLQLMDIMKKVAERHGLVACLHEKPLAGVNGSGKHLNWSIGDNTGNNYLEPSKSPLKNITFLLTIGAILLGVKKFGGVLRASVADAGNDHRLGANEAPPAIMSVYLGEYLNSLFNQIEGIGTVNEQEMAKINLGVQHLPHVTKDTSDRNRTSPIAFTGNKFEFRAVGSSHNCAEAATIMNLIVAYGYKNIYERIKNSKGDAKENAVNALKDILKETKAVRFEGNNYGEKWQKEAASRKLPNDKNTPAALKQYLHEDTVAVFNDFHILSREELKSKIEIKLEEYNNKKNIEYKTALDIVKTLILPAVTKQISESAQAVNQAGNAGVRSTEMINQLQEINELYTVITKKASELDRFLTVTEKENDLHKQAFSYAEEGSDLYEGLRAAVDKAEKNIAAEFWPMASYQDLLLEL
ncbi:MAG TPA: glutamine synthetase III [Spirochaetota bacterium]|nr:glutamine synthetase III [Spirochaetota bacterium]